jgi:lambda family phage tail tape measure protein
MADQELEKMLVVIDAQTERLRREMRKSRKSVQQFDRNVSRHLGSVDRTFSKIGAAAAAMRTKVAAAAAGMAGAFAIGGAFRGAKEALMEFDALAKQADTVGLSTDFYQAMQLGAEEAGVKQALLNSSLVAFVKRVGEAQAGTGSLITVFKKLRPDLLATLQSTKSQEEALKLLADAMQSTVDPQQRAALAAAAFSRAGVAMVRVLTQGRDGLDATMRKARELGIVIDEGLLRNSEKLANEYGVASMVIDRQFKQALIDLAPTIVHITRLTSGLVRGLRELYSGPVSFGPESSLQSLAIAASKTRKEIERLTAGSRAFRDANDFLSFLTFSQDTGRGSRDSRIKALREQLAAIEALIDAKKREKVIDASGGSGGTDPAVVAKSQEALRELQRLEERMLSATDQRHALITKRYADDVAKFREMLDQKRISQEQYDQAVLHLQRIRDAQLAQGASRMSTEGQEALRQLTDRMLSETSRRRELIEREYQRELQRFKDLLARKLISEEDYTKASAQLVHLRRERLKELNEEQKYLQQVVDIVARSMEDAFARFVETGKFNFKDFTRSILNDLAKIIFRLMVLQPLLGGGSGGGGGLLGNIIGSVMGSLGGAPIPALASGGPVTAGKPHLVGEKGPELFVPKTPGQIIANGAPMPSMGGEIVVTVAASPELDARIESTAENVVARNAPTIVGASVKATDRNLPGMIRKAQRRSF